MEDKDDVIRYLATAMLNVDIALTILRRQPSVERIYWDTEEIKEMLESNIKKVREVDG